MTSLGATVRRTEAQYSASYPPSLWSGPASGAREGSPGVWLPPGSTPPATFADLVAGVPNLVVAVPTTTWGAQSFVNGPGYTASWTGFDWAQLAVVDLDAIGDSTIPEVEEWVEAHPDQLDEVLAAERARGDAARVTLIGWLESRQEQT